MNERVQEIVDAYYESEEDGIRQLRKLMTQLCKAALDTGFAKRARADLIAVCHMLIEAMRYDTAERSGSQWDSYDDTLLKVCYAALRPLEAMHPDCALLGMQLSMVLAEVRFFYGEEAEGCGYLSQAAEKFVRLLDVRGERRIGVIAAGLRRAAYMAACCDSYDETVERQLKQICRSVADAGMHISRNTKDRSAEYLGDVAVACSEYAFLRYIDDAYAVLNYSLDLLGELIRNDYGKFRDAAETILVSLSISMRVEIELGDAGSQALRDASELLVRVFTMVSILAETDSAYWSAERDRQWKCMCVLAGMEGCEYLQQCIERLGDAAP